MAEAKLAFGEIKKRLVVIWTEKGKDASYKDVQAVYKKAYPKDATPSDQTVGNARKKAFNLVSVPRKGKTPAGPTMDNTIAVFQLLNKEDTTADELLMKVKETPVNPFQHYDNAAGSRENLEVILNKLTSAKTAADLVS